MTSSKIDDLTLNYTFIKCEEEGYRCDFDQSKIYLPGEQAFCVSKTRQLSNLVYGQFCDDDSQCYSKKCSGGKCKGFKEDETCSSHEYCEKELYCHPRNSSCTLQITWNNVTCQEDHWCTNNRICHNSYCVLPYTLDDGERSNNAKMCKSGTLATTISGLSICDSYLLTDTSLECSASKNTCNYKWNITDTTFSLDCICTMNGTGKKMCPADHRREFRNEEAFKLITMGKAHTLLRDISQWEGLQYNRFYPNKEMDKCVSEAISGAYKIISNYTLLSLIIFLFLIGN